MKVNNKKGKTVNMKSRKIFIHSLIFIRIAYCILKIFNKIIMFFLEKEFYIHILILFNFIYFYLF
jgi:hypothetical protein